MDGLPPLPRKKQNTAFYELPKGVQSSWHVIEDARRSVRCLPTTRPLTPAHTSRSLYGGGSATTGRPPSVFSLTHSSYQDESSRPSTAQRLTPIPLTKVNDAVRPVPPTPIYSSANITSSSTTLLPMVSTQSASTTSTSSTTDDREVMMPALIESKHSPERSRRVCSASTSIMASTLAAKRVASAGDIIERKNTSSLNDKLGNDKAKKTKEKRTKSSPQEVWMREIVPLIEVLETESGDVHRLCAVCDELWSVLGRNGMLGKTGGTAGTKRRTAVLKCLFKMLHFKEPKLLMKLAKIIFGMKVTGKNLLNACRLVFSLSKEETNDKLFLEEKIAGPLIDVLLSCDPLMMTDTVVYGVGTLKLLASNTHLRDELGKGGVVKLLCQYFEQCSSLANPSDEELANTGCVLVQLSETLRNLSDSPSLYPSFYSLFPCLASSLAHHTHNTELVFNTARFLSKLSLHHDSCGVIISCSELLSLTTTLLSTHLNNSDIAVRLCFILGNFTESSSCSQTLCDYHSLLPITENVIEHYLTIMAGAGDGGGGGGDSGDVAKPEDVLIKAARVLANLSVHSGVAGMISTSSTTIELTMRILAELSVSQSSELIFNTLAVLNNLTYHCTDGLSVLDEYQQEITLLLVELLFEDHRDVMLECCRVLGNLSRHSVTRNILAEKRVDELMVTLLDSKQVELVYSTCGVLINLLADPQHRHVLTKNSGVRKLVDVLVHFGRQDWQLASLVCKTLWNYSEDITTSNSCFGEEETEVLLHLLEDFLDPVTAFISFDGEEDEKEEEESSLKVQSHSHRVWENEFVPVARSLLNRIHQHHTSLVPL